MTDFSGFDNLAGELDDLAEQFGEMADNAEELEGENTVSFEDLFAEEFMRKYTDVTSFESFIEQSQWQVESEEDFEAIPEDEFDEYVKANSDFESWEDMFGTAAKEWIAREIGFQ